MKQAVDTREWCRADVEGSKVTRGIFVPPGVFVGGVLLHAAQALPFSRRLSSWPRDRQLPPRPNCSGPPSCVVLCLCLSRESCPLFRAESSPVVQCSAVQCRLCSAALKSNVERISPLQNPGALRALHALLPETRLTLQVQYSTVQSNSSPRDTDLSGERRFSVQGAGMVRFGASGFVGAECR